jgi:hypothetical protein
MLLSRRSFVGVALQEMLGIILHHIENLGLDLSMSHQGFLSGLSTNKLLKVYLLLNCGRKVINLV